MATTYVNSFKPSLNDLKKLKIRKRLKKNNDIIILRPDKGSGVLVLDKLAYNDAISDLLSRNTKFKKNCNLISLRREGQLQRYLRKIMLLTVTFIPPVLNQLGYMEQEPPFYYSFF